MAAKIVVVGSCMTDLISYAPRLPKSGETLHGYKFTIGFGGKGANQCITGARLGAATAMVAKVGDDSFGHSYIENFRKNNVDVTHVGVTKAAATGVAPIIVDDSGENYIVCIAGANMEMTEEDVDKAEEMIASADVVVCQAEITAAATARAVKLAKSLGVKTLVNAAPGNADLPMSIIEHSDIFCVNETEAEVMTGVHIQSVKDAEVAADALLKKGCSSVIITLGAEGAFYSTPGSHMHIPAKKVTPVDTTGAGDAFVGALSYYLVYKPNLQMPDMIRHACDIATITVQSPGTQTSFPYREQLSDDLFI